MIEPSSVLAQDYMPVSIRVPQPVLDVHLEIERLKRSFANTLVRDIRLPLTSVLGVLELLESKIHAREAFDLEDRQLLGAAIKNGDFIRHMIDDLMEIARQHDCPLNLNLEGVRADELLSEVADPMRGVSALRGVELKVEKVAPSLYLHVDKSQAQRALCHLLKAALAATPEAGTVNITANEIVSTRAGDEGRRFAVISVSHSGPGIPREEIPFIFDAFWQAGTGMSTGRGVGLSIAKRIAAAHGGNVSVRSVDGKGATYSIVFNLFQSEEETKSYRVLIVDDSPEILLLLRKFVERMGFQVETATGAAEALLILGERQIDILVTDWAMPQMSGGDLIAAVKKNHDWLDIPIIVLTGHDTDTERMDATRLGCDRFLVKPLKLEELENVIADLLKISEKKHLNPNI